jgi:hypothetical protein
VRLSGGEIKAPGVRVGLTRREELVTGIPQDPNLPQLGVGSVIHHDVGLAVDLLGLVDRQARVLADFDLPILSEPAQVAVAVAL